MAGGARMGYLLRHLLSVLVLPVTVVVLIPLWIGHRYGVRPTWPASPLELALAVGGVLALVAGLALSGASLHHFFSRGQGTLAPWDPPRRLVIGGPYRYVRNPMIAGVIFMLIGEAAVLGSMPHARWAGLFLIINTIYIPLLEEPMLRQRFGGAYDRYKRNVPRFIPRLRPWREEDEDPSL